MKKMLSCLCFLIGVGFLIAGCAAGVNTENVVAKENNERAEDYVIYEFAETDKYYEDIEQQLLVLANEHRNDNGKGSLKLHPALERNAELRAVEISKYGLGTHQNERSGFKLERPDDLYALTECVLSFPVAGYEYSAEDWATIIFTKSLETLIHEGDAHNVTGISVYGNKDTIYVSWHCADQAD